MPQVQLKVRVPAHNPTGQRDATPAYIGSTPNANVCPPTVGAAVVVAAGNKAGNGWVACKYMTASFPIPGVADVQIVS